ncbi:MAG: biotin transporter BioY [Rhodospirillales bacterium]
MAHAPQSTTLADALIPAASDSHGWLRHLVLAFAGSVLLAISAKINIPFYPVPMTMQTFMVLTIGMAFGWRLGGATVLLYLCEGAFGLPVFAGTPEKGIGLAYMAGPTGGYLLGFFLAAVFVGWLAEKGWDRNIFTTLAAMTIGTSIIFIPGVIWLGMLFGWEKPILEWGLIPFLPGAAFKIALAAAVLPLTWKYMVSKDA